MYAVTEFEDGGIISAWLTPRKEGVFKKFERILLRGEIFENGTHFL